MLTISPYAGVPHKDRFVTMINAIHKYGAY
jgi:hypothetical protein